MTIKKERLYKLIKFIPMILIMIIIFAFSCKQGDESSEQSGRLLQAIVKVVESISSSALSAEVLGFLHLFIRKAAHFTEYAVLGISILYATYSFYKKKWLSVPLSLLLSAVYASTDEIHQYFVPGRYGTPSDVLIDSCGALTGIIVIYFVVYSHHGKHYEQREDK